MTIGNVVFGKDLYAANKDALADYCGKIKGVGAGRASDTPSAAVIGDLEGEWEGTIEITGGSAKDGTFKATGDFGYSDGQHLPYIDIYQEGYEDAVISFWCSQKLSTGIATPSGMYDEGNFFEHIISGSDFDDIVLVNRDGKVEFDYGYNDGYTCHVKITLTKK